MQSDKYDGAPEGRKKNEPRQRSTPVLFRPSGAPASFLCLFPRTHAVGYILPPPTAARRAFTFALCLLPIAFRSPSGLRPADAFAHLADGLGEAGEDGAGDDVVADVELGDLGDGGDLRDVAVGQPVAGGDVQAVLRGERGGLAQAVEFGGDAHAPLGVDGARAERRLGVGGRAELDLLRARLVRRLDLARLGVYEEADEEAVVAQAVDRAADRVEAGDGVQAALGRDLVGALGDERDGVGARVACDGDHLLGGGHLDVEVGGDRAPERVDVLVLYVAAVAAQVDGDAVRP